MYDIIDDIWYQIICQHKTHNLEHAIIDGFNVCIPSSDGALGRAEERVDVSSRDVPAGTCSRRFARGDTGRGANQSLGLRMFYARPTVCNFSKVNVGDASWWPAWAGKICWLDAVGTAFLLEVGQAACMKSQISMGAERERRRGGGNHPSWWWCSLMCRVVFYGGMW